MLKSRWLQWSFLFILVIIVAVFVARSMITKAVQDVVVEQLMEGFDTETAQTRFLSYATMVAPLKRLEIAKINQVELFERSSQAKLFWDRLKLPEVVVRATVPVEYRYYVELDHNWQFQTKDKTLYVMAPPPLAGTPSADISKLKFEVRKGSFFRNEVKVVQALQGELTALLEKRATDSAVLIRETARQQIEVVVKDWLQTEKSEVFEVKVGFADEKPTNP